MKVNEAPQVCAMPVAGLDEYTTVPYEDPRYTTSRGRRFLFSCSGAFVGLRNLPNSLRSFKSAIARKLFGAYPDGPFIPYAARTALAGVLSKDMTVVEVGAGMSTLWLAERVHWVSSYEWSAEWCSLLREKAVERRLDNVHIRHCIGISVLSFEEIAADSFDFAFIDGGVRSIALVNLWPKLKRGGFVYLDNWDSDLFWLDCGCDGRAFLRSKRDEIAEVRLFVDFIPTYLSVCEGLLARKA